MHFATGCTQPTTGGFLAADPVTLLRCYARLSRLHSSAPAEPAPFPQLQSMELQDEPNLGVHPAKKIKAAFYAELIPLLDQVSEQSQHMLHKGSFPWHEKRRRTNILLGRVTGVTSAGGSDCSQSWSAHEHPSVQKKPKKQTQSRKFIWAETRYKMSLQNKFPNNYISKCFWRRVGKNNVAQLLFWGHLAFQKLSKIPVYLWGLCQLQQNPCL